MGGLNRVMPIKDIEQLLDKHAPISGNHDIEHWWDKQTIYAVIAAVSARRPLLVLGESGLGKSQIAAAAAHALKREYLSVVVHPQLEAQDLLWSFDYTARLAEAQLKGKDNTTLIREDGDYLCPGPLWWAIDPKTACECKSTHHYAPPWGKVDSVKAQKIAQRGTVLLIDEIDKADSGVANSLLETLGDRAFNVPHMRTPIKAQEGDPHPLIVFTSNEDRDLPAPFLRRCTVLHLEMPDNIKAHFGCIGSKRYPRLDHAVIYKAADQIIADRDACQDKPRTGLAEYLDLLQALDSLTGEEQDEAQRVEQQEQWLLKLSGYFSKQKLSAQ